MPHLPKPSSRRRTFALRPLHLLIAFLLTLGSVLAVPLSAYAEDQGSLAIDKTVEGFEEGQQVKPGDTFDYTITITCSNIGVGGCTNAVLTDTLPAGLSLNKSASDIAVTGQSGTAAANGNDITVTFTEEMVDPAGEPGLLPGQATVTIPVVVDEDIDPSLDGEDLTNTATVAADNATEKSDDFTVVPDIPINLKASTDKKFAPNSAVANPGTKTTMTLTGGNKSNVPVDEITLTDPTDPPGAFTYLALTGDFEVTLPPGAEQVQVDCYVDGSWQNGTASAPPATLPSSVDDPADCEGVRIHFISTDGANIAPDASGSIDVELEQRDNIADAGDGPINNEVSTTVTAGDDTSDPATADDDYTLTSADIDLSASKKFSPDVIAAGGTSTVTIGATNTSDLTLDSMTIKEPGADPNMFENGLTFSGWGDVQWPAGATGATVEFTYANPPSPVTETADEPNTLPDPAPGRTVTGFTVTFTGPIEPGAEASIPFTVTADEEQASDEVEHPNTIKADSTAPGGYHGDATADDTLTTIIKRIAIDTGKKIIPSQGFSIPGQQVRAELSATVEDFPASTTNANQVIIQEPADPAIDTWFDSFAPTGVVNAAIPAGATLTVQYWDGTEWVTVPGMDQIPGPTAPGQFTADFPPDVQQNAQGIRLVYDSPDTGFPPGTTFTALVDFQLKPSAADQDLTIEDCASSSAKGAGADDAQGDPACDDINIVPPTPGNADFIVKSWDDPAAVQERTQQEAGATIGWSTNGATGIDQMVISDIPEPAAGSLPKSVYDSFDLVRIDPITDAMDPRLKYDQITGVELYSIAAGDWIKAPNDPCPAACDETFPGYTLSTDSRADTIAFRLTYAESPNRVVDSASAPPIGSGVAISEEHDRHLHPVFRLRDELRSNNQDPVLAADTYNVDGETGTVRNTARATLIVDGSEFYHEDAFDDILITPVDVTADITKEWIGGPMGAPAPGTASFPNEYPTGTVRLEAQNTTPRKVDRLTITEPAGGTDPFNEFNLRAFDGITEPSTIGATDVTITLKLAGGGTETMTRDQALAAAEADLTDVVGFTVVYTGRIVEAGKAVVVFDTRLRDVTRDNSTPITGPETVHDIAGTEVADLVDYPDVDPVTSTDADAAEMDIEPSGIGLNVTKTFDPDEQTEPDNSPVDVTLTGQPEGPSRTVKMVITDEDVTFFNQYDFVYFGDFSFTAPIDRVQVDALTGGTFTVVGGQVVRTGASWVNGTPGTTLELPDGVSAADVVGLRFTFTRADGALWENPATPTQKVVLQVKRRTELRTGGPVLTDMAGNAPAPGEENPGEASDTIQGDNWAADTINDEPLTAHDEATDTIGYRHSTNAVEVTKSPTGAQPPGANIDYTLTFTNTGKTPITNPVITDHIPSDGDGPLLVYDPDRAGPGTGYTFALTGDAPDPPNGSAMPTDPAQVGIDETPTLITFTFPAGTVLEVGQTYTITTPLQFRPGLPGNTEVTNTTGITGDRPWDDCQQTLDEDSGECQASTTVYPTRAGALRGVKSVKALDDELGVLDTRDTGCTPDADGFYVGGCVPVTKPGKEDVWRMTFANTGNLPMDKVYAIDRLPVPGDTGAIIDLERGSQWTPKPQTLTYQGVTLGTVTSVRVYYDTDQDLCTDILSELDGCDNGEWTLIRSIDNPTVGGSIPIPADATAILVEADFDEGGMLQPTGTVTMDLTTTAPAQSPTAGADTIAWNTVAASGETNDDGTLRLAPPTEGNKVGAALATGRLAVEKKVEGPASEYAPSSFDLTLHCTSVDEDVDLGDQAAVTAKANEVTPVDVDIPWASECTVTEDAAAAGNPQFSADAVTIGRAPDVVQLTATNTYPDASLSLAKDVDGPALDQEGNPIKYGPFTFTVDCTYLGKPVYADGYSADNPMTVQLSSGDDPITFTELPAGSTCTATETSDGGASSTTSTGTTGAGTDDEATIDGDDSIELVLTPDGEDPVVTNTVTFTNTFPTGSVVITKEVTGSGAERYGAGPFTVHLRCVDAREPRRTVYDGDLVLGGAQPLTATVENLYVNSTCRVTEPNTGGATSTTISPAGAFRVTADSATEPVQVSVTNQFDVGSLQVTKKIVDSGGRVSDDQLFEFQLSCVREVNGIPRPVELDNDGNFSLSIDGGLTQTWDDLPTGAVCTVSETGNGGADATTIEPGEVTIGSDTTVKVVATNTFDPLPPAPDDSDNSSDNSQERLPNTGGPQLALLLIGLALLASGGSVLARARRRG